MNDNGNRFHAIPIDSMTPAQRRVRDNILSGPRAGVLKSLPNLFNVWLHSPELCDKAQDLGAFVRLGTSLDKRISELAILCVARQWSCAFEWSHHAPLAAEYGVSEEVIEAIRTHGKPHFEKTDEAIVYQVCRELFETRGLGDSTFSEAEREFGDAGLVELIAIIGYYTFAAMTLNVFEVPFDEGYHAELPD